MKAYFFNLLFVINLTNSLLCDKIIFDSNNENSSHSYHLPHSAII